MTYWQYRNLCIITTIIIACPVLIVTVSMVKLVVSCVVFCAVCGFGFGVISGAFSLVNVLADMTGPGTVGIMGQSSHFFITSGRVCSCFGEWYWQTVNVHEVTVSLCRCWWYRIVSEIG